MLLLSTLGETKLDKKELKKLRKLQKKEKNSKTKSVKNSTGVYTFMYNR